MSGMRRRYVNGNARWDQTQSDVTNMSHETRQGVVEKARRTWKAVASALPDEVPVLIEMSELALRRVRPMPAEALTKIIASLLYLVTPVDLIPDCLPIVGLVDDAAVLKYVIGLLRDEIVAFRAW